MNAPNERASPRHPPVRRRTSKECVAARFLNIFGQAKRRQITLSIAESRVELDAQTRTSRATVDQGQSGLPRASLVTTPPHQLVNAIGPPLENAVG